ncbi:hypothetical protein BU15DRAFT_61345 [Melanogaster broomeanus]|nr:hypothetical protein BU15DRAFT_61345 [Melanogaster broomeanus]
MGVQSPRVRQEILKPRNYLLLLEMTSADFVKRLIAYESPQLSTTLHPALPQDCNPSIKHHQPSFEPRTLEDPSDERRSLLFDPQVETSYTSPPSHMSPLGRVIRLTDANHLQAGLHQSSPSLSVCPPTPGFADFPPSSQVADPGNYLTTRNFVHFTGKHTRQNSHSLRSYFLIVISRVPAAPPVLARADSSAINSDDELGPSLQASLRTFDMKAQAGETCEHEDAGCVSPDAAGRQGTPKMDISMHVMKLHKRFEDSEEYHHLTALIRTKNLMKPRGLKWAWCDTCCINKAKISRKRMVHPCWTLQELLAPKVMQFYEQSWKPCVKGSEYNHKEVQEWVDTLEQITGIPAALFATTRRQSREKLRWAASRTTSRQEDIGYCLIGIFDVSLTPHYGEGDKAFTRLLLKIMKSTRDISLFDWVGNQSNSVSYIPSSPNGFCHPPLPDDQLCRPG